MEDTVVDEPPESFASVEVRRSPHLSEHADDLFASDAAAARARDEHVDVCEHIAVSWSAGDRDPAAAPELEEALVAQDAERPQHGVDVDVEDGGEVLGWREALARPSFALGE